MLTESDYLRSAKKRKKPIRRERNMLTQEKPNNGQFTKGTSGNPGGRPPGSRNKATLLMEALLEGEAEQLARKAIELGKAGNIHALQLCLDRLTPPCKDRLVCFDLPSMRSLDDISVGIARIVTAVSEGNLTPQEGEVVFRILEGHAKIMNTQDLVRRVEKLERGPSRNERKIEVVKSYC